MKITHEESIPPGLSGNPSQWPARLPLVALAIIGFAISTYLALYQWRIVSHVWEPFFGDGSEKVLLHSPISRMLPVPDSLLGACAYAADILFSARGGEQRWRTNPRWVICFGALAGAMAVVSLGLLLSQPLLAHAWCALCLCSALISFIIAGLATKEVRASLQFLKRQKQDSVS